MQDLDKPTSDQYFKPRDEKTYPTRRAESIEPNKVYRTRGGERVRVYAIEGNEIHGAIHHRGNWEIDTWSKDGKYLAGKGKEHGRDILLSPPLRIMPGNKYKSRDGRVIEIFKSNRGSVEFPLLGAIKDELNNWVPRIWNDAGVTKFPYGPNNDIVAEWSEG